MWTVVELTLPREALGPAEALLELAGAAAVSLTDAGDSPLLEPAPGTTPVWPQVRVEALFAQPVSIQRLTRTLSDTLGTTIALQTRPLDDGDWQNAWRQHWQPLRFGGRLTVAPAQDKPDDSADIVVRLTPGLAFGTGQHPTTALCLQWLANQNLVGRTLCDYGTGSGLLAIAAARLGAAHVYAVDIDPQAVEACDANARNNDIRDQLTIGTPDTVNNLAVDIVIANILSETLKALAPRLGRLVALPGELILSGILTEQAADVTAAYEPWFSFTSPTERDGWVCLHGRTRSPA